MHDGCKIGPWDEGDIKPLIAADSRERRGSTEEWKVKREEEVGKREMAFRDPGGTLEWGPTVRVPLTANDSNNLEIHNPRGVDECITI